MVDAHGIVPRMASSEQSKLSAAPEPIAVVLARSAYLSSDEFPLARRGGSMVACIVIGVLALLVGLYYLFNPSVTVPSSSIYSSTPDRVINLQRLAIGGTFTLVGAVFLAAAIRPR